MIPEESTNRNLNVSQEGVNYDSASSEIMILETLRTFCPDGIVEVRCLNVGGRNNRVDAGYYTDFERAAADVQRYVNDGKTSGVYFTMNAPDPALLARSANRMTEWTRCTTSDTDIIERRWLLVDCDAKRPAGISSTEAELDAAQERGADVTEWLLSKGMPEPVTAMSGNGCHVLVPVKLPNDDAATKLVRAVLELLHYKFSDDRVTIDTAVSNPARICRLYGTYARKGDDVPGRPHRMARLVHVPDYIQRRTGEHASEDTLQRLAAMHLPAQTSSGRSRQPADVQTPDTHELLDALRTIPSHDYDTWLTCGMALHSHSDTLLPEWIEWSSTSDNFQPGICEKKWQTFSAAGGVNATKIFHLASQHGWQSVRRQNHHPSEQSGADTRLSLSPVDDSRSERRENEVIVDTLQVDDGFVPFPIDQLPEVLRRFSDEVAQSVGCDSSFPAFAVLTVCAAAIGNSRQLRVKNGWFVPPILWAVLVGESGTQKSPPLKAALAPLKERQSRDTKAYEAASREYNAALKAYKRELKAWEKDREGPEPAAPQIPIHRRCIVGDVTIEALATVHLSNPRGVLLVRDELAGWFAGFDQYKSRKSAASSEVPKWLEIYNAEPITIDRKTGDQRVIIVPRPFTCILGGIQPGILARCLTAEHRESGLQSRLMMTYPPRVPKRWRDAEISSATQTAYSDCVRELFNLQPDDSSGGPSPATLRLSDDALNLYKSYVNRTGAEQAAMDGHLASQWSKLEEMPIRLAIVHHCVRQVSEGVSDPWVVDADSMAAAIAITEWLKSEAIRISRLLAEPEEVRRANQLAKWISQQGGRISARDLCRLRRDIPTSAQAEQLLMELVSMGLGSWSSTRKSREFVLHQRDLSTNSG